jgi:hypothetical protein
MRLDREHQVDLVQQFSLNARGKLADASSACDITTDIRTCGKRLEASLYQFTQLA